MDPKDKKSKKGRKPKKTLHVESEDFLSKIARFNNEIGAEDVENWGKLEAPTGILPLDIILSPAGGFRAGCAEIYGPEGTGKTSLTLSLIRACVDMEIPALLFDAEFRLTDELCAIWGLTKNVDFLFRQYRSGGKLLKKAESFIKNAPMSVVVIDSIPAIQTDEELDSDVTDRNYSGLYMSNFAKRMPKFCRSNNCLLIYLNQVRANIDKFSRSKYRAPGPMAIRFFTDWRIEMSKIQTLKEAGKDGEVIGQLVQFKTHKNLLMKPYQTARSHLIYGQGFHIGYDLIDMCKTYGMTDLMKMSGHWVEFYTGEKFNGNHQAAKYIKENKEVQAHISKALKETISEVR